MLDLAVTTILVTASGALSPGPLFFALITQGARSGAKGGLGFAIAHTLIELPLVILLAPGFFTVASQPAVKVITGIAGGLALILFGGRITQEGIIPRKGKPTFAGVTSRNPLILGLLFTGLNPYFIIWWLTIGVKLVVDSILLASLTGVMIMFAFHIWMDYAWLVCIAHLAKKGANILGTKGYRILVFASGISLVYFGLNFLMSALFTLVG